jgi:hypothetical protein
VPEQRNDVNLDDEFVKIVPDKNLSKSEEIVEKVDKTADCEILNKTQVEINRAETVETEKNSEEIVQKIDDVNTNDPESNVVSGERTDKEEDLTEKPPVPIQTYLWEDVKRSKEQVSDDNVCTTSTVNELYHYTVMS